MKRITALAIASGLLLTTVVHAETLTADQVKAKAATCGACHGPDGNGLQPIYPRLAGQYHDYLAQALHEYKSGERSNAIMAGFAATLSDSDIDALARYFAEMPTKLDDLSKYEQGN